MGLLDFIHSFISNSKAEQKINWRVIPTRLEDVEFIFPPQAASSHEHFAKQHPLFALQFCYLKSLQDRYPVEFFRNGFSIPASILPDLGEDFHSMFEMPSYFSGKYKAEIKSNSSKNDFSVTLKLEMPDGSTVSHFSLLGPFLKLTENELYSLTPAEYMAFKALEQHQELPESERSEYENNWLIFKLQTAIKSGMRLDLGHFNQENLEIIKPESIGVALNQLPNGDVELIPAISGVDAMDVRRRLGQMQGQDKRLIRVNDKFVIFDEDRIKAIEEIFPIDKESGTRKVRVIKKNQFANFLQNPTAYLDGAKVDLDTGFSLRVLGAEKFVHKYFGGEVKSGINWLALCERFLHSPRLLINLVKSEEQFEEIKELIQNAKNLGATVIEVEDHQIDISNSEEVEEILTKIKHRLKADDEGDPPPFDPDDTKPEKAVVNIEDNDEENHFERFISSFKSHSASQLDISNLKRRPFPHQQKGIDWILSHLNAVEMEQTESGALLADDMGLGKTYMTLVSISEYYRRQMALKQTKKPVLVVAPLSLLENWQAEIDETFIQSPFDDVVVLQGAGLKRYSLGGNEVKQYLHNDIASADEIRYSLKIGKEYANERLDMPARLVLTTYDNLRAYQFSLCRVDWSLVIFDEAQHLKNPNTLATRAAKGLKAEFKLLTTGTPVENSLKDFWCLMDTATPGLLKSWKEFRETYIRPIEEADEIGQPTVKYEIGKILRKKVGDFMLRRTKSEELPGLPNKVVYSGCAGDESYLPILDAKMQGVQLLRYNNVLTETKGHSRDKRGLILTALLELRMLSVHPNLRENDQRYLLDNVDHSSKLLSMLTVIEEIRKRGEKVLIFAIHEKVQCYLAALMMMTYGINVDIINGKTAAVSTTKSKSRKAIIDEFQAKEGFGVLVMSPIAAGVGLTITGANNVIHLERHWNPAKEAQATDRVYRIGQKKQVNVYLPMATHPQVLSFDLHLHRLLNNKVDLSEAVVANPDILPEDLMEIFNQSC